MSAISEDSCVKYCAQATEEVLVQVLDGEVKRGELSLVQSPVEILEVAVILGLTGDYEGRILFEFSHATALKIAVTMNFGGGAVLQAGREMPVDAFGVYIQPEPYIVKTLTLSLASGESLTQQVHGEGGARFFGWTGLDAGTR